MALKLEVFDTADKPSKTQTVVLDRVALEEEKLASYDAGFRAGWDDLSHFALGVDSRLAELAFTHRPKFGERDAG